ncbi:MAG: glutaredoxin family protein [Gammaproteobacteria bacterium]
MTNKKRRSFVTTAIWVGLFLIAMNWQTLWDTAKGAVHYQADLAGPVTVFSTAWCGYCKKTKHFLVTHDIPFEERDIEASVAARDAFDRLGGSGVPLVLVGEKAVHGYSLKRLRAALECADCDFTQQE